MRWFLRAAAVVAAVGVIAGPARALVARVNSPAQRAVTADVVIVGKLTAFEKDPVEAAPFPGAPKKVAFKVAVVKVEKNLAGAENLTHLKVGFVPRPAGAPNAAPPGGVRPPVRPGLGVPELKEGDEFLFFLVRQPDTGFHVMPLLSPPIDLKGDAGRKEVDAVKKVLAVVADPAKALKAEAPADRYFAATVLVTKYRSRPESAREVGEVPIPAEEGRLILKALAEGDWAKFDMGTPNGMQALNLLNLTEADGWVRPKPQPGVNYNQLTRDAFAKWVEGPGKDYRVKRLVPKK